MKLYDIVKSLQEAQGRLAKEAIMFENKDNELFKAYMSAVMDPSINYYQSKVPPGVVAGNLAEIDFEFLAHMSNWSNRVYTGSKAISMMKQTFACLDAESLELAGYIIKRSIGGSVGDSMVLKTWPDLYFIPPYQRCALMTLKIKAKFAELPFFYVQTKADGSFAYIQHSRDGSLRVMTRAGTVYPQEIANQFQGIPKGHVLVGELLCYRDGKMLDRKTGNGILNSLHKDGAIPDGIVVRMSAWDVISEEFFVAGKSEVPYKLRFDYLQKLLSETTNIDLIEHHKVTSIKEAYEIYAEHLARGEEGVICKNPDGLWRDNSSGSQDDVKLKMKFQADYVITDYYEGEGKAKGMLGGVVVETIDNKLKSKCGSGFSDDERKRLWKDRESLPGCIVTIEANGVESSRSKSTLSLFLPIYIEIRLDKTVADTIERVYEQFEAAKLGE